MFLLTSVFIFHLNAVLVKVTSKNILNGAATIGYFMCKHTACYDHSVALFLVNLDLYGNRRNVTHAHLTAKLWKCIPQGYNMSYLQRSQHDTQGHGILCVN